MKASLTLAAILAVATAAPGLAASPTAAERGKTLPVTQPYSAEPIACPGVSNLYRVTPTLYRSAQPDAKGLEHLARDLGIRTVVNLRDDLSDLGFDPPQSLRLRYVEVKISSFDIPQNDGRLLFEALAAIRAAERRGKVLVHCERGADRTGTVVALYRMKRQGWSADRAIAEMEHGPYAFNPYYAVTPIGNVPAFLESVGRQH